MCGCSVVEAEGTENSRWSLWASDVSGYRRSASESVAAPLSTLPSESLLVGVPI